MPSCQAIVVLLNKTLPQFKQVSFFVPQAVIVNLEVCSLCARKDSVQHSVSIQKLQKALLMMQLSYGARMAHLFCILQLLL